MKIIFTLLTICFTLGLFGQNQDEFKTIFGGREVGGYGAFSAGYTTVDSVNAAVFHARGGVILGRILAIGLGGTGFVSEYRYDQKLDMDASLVGGYGGAYLELIILGKSPVHLSVPLFCGLGSVSYSVWENKGTEYERMNYIEDASSFLVFEPGVELEFNINRFCRLAAFFNMRYTNDIDITTTNTSGGNVVLVSPEALNSYSAGIILKFGKFR